MDPFGVSVTGNHWMLYCLAGVGHALLLCLASSITPQDNPESLIQKLSDPAVEVRDEAERNLVALKAAALPHLNLAKNVKDLEAQGRVRRAIAKIERTLTIDALRENIPLDIQTHNPNLIESIMSEQASTRLSALRLISGVEHLGDLQPSDIEDYPYASGTPKIVLKDKALLVTLEVFLKDREPTVRATALVGVLNHKMGSLSELVGLLAGDDNAEVRVRALEALPMSLGDRALPVLRNMLADSSGKVVRRAAKLLHSRLDKNSVPSFRDCLKIPIRRPAVPSALVALGELGDTASLDQMVGFLGDRDPAIVAAACRALVVLDAKNRAGELAKILSQSNLEARTHAAFALALLGEKSCLESMVKAQHEVTDQIEDRKQLGLGDGRDVLRYPDVFVVARAILGDSTVSGRLSEVVLYPQASPQDTNTSYLLGIPEVTHLDLLLASQAILEPKKSQEFWAMAIPDDFSGSIRELGESVMKALGHNSGMPDPHNEWPSFKFKLSGMRMARAFRIYANHSQYTLPEKGGHLFGEPLQVQGSNYANGELGNNDIWSTLSRMIKKKFQNKP